MRPGEKAEQAWSYLLCLPELGGNGRGELVSTEVQGSLLNRYASCFPPLLSSRTPPPLPKCPTLPFLARGWCQHAREAFLSRMYVTERRKQPAEQHVPVSSLRMITGGEKNLSYT